MKHIVVILFVFLICVAAKPVKTPYNHGNFPRIKIVEQGGGIKVKIKTPDSTYSYSEILTALKQHWTIVNESPDATVEFVNSNQGLTVYIERDSITPTQNQIYHIKYNRSYFIPIIKYLSEKKFQLCVYKGKNLYGRVKIVEHNADFKIKSVKKEDDYDLNVFTDPSIVKDDPNCCGRWQLVDDDSYDFTVQFVEKDPDFTVYHYGPWETPQEEKQEAYSEANQESQTTGNSGKSIVDCKCQGIPLHGRVQVVSAFATFRVCVVSAFQDLDVRCVDAFPDNCGEWQFVDAFPDFTIEFVSAFPDFTIRYVDAFPGQN